MNTFKVRRGGLLLAEDMFEFAVRRAELFAPEVFLPSNQSSRLPLSLSRFDEMREEGFVKSMRPLEFKSHAYSLHCERQLPQRLEFPCSSRARFPQRVPS